VPKAYDPRSRRWSEYTLYCLALEARGLFDCLHSPETGRNLFLICPTSLWFQTGATWDPGETFDGTVHILRRLRCFVVMLGLAYGTGSGSNCSCAPDSGGQLGRGKGWVFLRIELLMSM
jgi:hypothetical protein